MTWKTACSFDELQTRPAVFKSGARQIAVFRSNGDVFAVDNRCPHEGYPLAGGTVDGDCVLTCNWHNWKFRLADGECVLGGDNVRTYPVRMDEGQVLVDVSDPPPEQIEADILQGLHTAFRERDFGRICRELARLHYNRLDPLAGVCKAVEWSHDRFEFGATHAWAATADWLQLAARHAGDFERQLVCLAEPVDHMAFDALRHQIYAYPAANGEFSSERFLAAVEAEDRTTAESLVVAAVRDGLGWDDLEESFASAALAHYNDFGHSLIYVYKLRQLLEQAGEELLQFVAPSLARSICYATREDLIPEFKPYAAAIQSLPEPRTTGAAPHGDLPPPFPASTRECFDWLHAALKSHPVEAVYDALLEALADNLLHFDLSYQSAFDRPVSQNVGWLDFTHGVTFANACRAVCSRYPHLWRPALLQMACFVGRNRSFIDVDLDEAPWRVDDAETFLADVYERVLDHGLRDPIFSAHLVKTSVAVEDELTAASTGCRRKLLASLNRFLNSPLKQNHVRRLARQAIALVQRDFAGGG